MTRLPVASFSLSLRRTPAPQQQFGVATIVGHSSPVLPIGRAKQELPRCPVSTNCDPCRRPVECDPSSGGAPKFDATLFSTDMDHEIGILVVDEDVVGPDHYRVTRRANV